MIIEILRHLFFGFLGFLVGFSIGVLALVTLVVLVRLLWQLAHRRYNRISIGITLLSFIATIWFFCLTVDFFATAKFENGVITMVLGLICLAIFLIRKPSLRVIDDWRNLFDDYF